MNIDRDLNRLAADVLSADPRTALIACRRLGEELEWLEQRAAASARRADWPWARIAKLLGTSRQATHRRFRHLDQAPELRPPSPVGPGLADERSYFRIERDVRITDDYRAWDQSGDDVVPW